MKLYKEFLITVSYLFLINALFSVQGIAIQPNETLSDAKIIQQLQSENIKPYTTYIQKNYINSDYKNFPTQPFVSLLEAEWERLTTPYNEINFIQLDNNYQYKTILTKSRKLIDILYPLDVFSNYKDGEYFFTLDKDNQLHRLNTVEEALTRDCYIKVIIYKGQVISIQKRPLDYIKKITFEYWDNGNIQKEISDRFNLVGAIIEKYEVTYDQSGQQEKMVLHNFITQSSSITSIIKKNNIYSITDIYNNSNIKTNHIIIYNHESGPVENQNLDSLGNILKVTTNEYYFNNSFDLPQSLPYQNLPMNLEKANSTHVYNLFSKPFTNKDNTQFDQEAINRALFLGIKPNSEYYHSTPFPIQVDERYKNFPHQRGLNLEQAEFQHPTDKYVDLVKVTIGANYQYKTIDKTKWRQTAISLPIEQFKELENGSYFFIKQNDGKLQALDGVDQAIQLPSYIRVEKVMGKIVSILEKVRIQQTSYDYQYDNNKITQELFNIIESDVIAAITVKSKFDDRGNYPIYQEVINSHKQIISALKIENKKDLYGIIERYNPDGIKINHITISNDGEIENQYLDGQGHVTFTSDEIEDKDNPQPYEVLPFIISDTLEQDIFKLYLSQNGDKN